MMTTTSRYVTGWSSLPPSRLLIRWCFSKLDHIKCMCWYNQYTIGLTQPEPFLMKMVDGSGRSDEIQQQTRCQKKGTGRYWLKSPGPPAISLRVSSCIIVRGTHNSSWEWKRLNFALPNTAARYWRAMEKVLKKPSKFTWGRLVSDSVCRTASPDLRWSCLGRSSEAANEKLTPRRSQRYWRSRKEIQSFHQCSIELLIRKLFDRNDKGEAVDAELWTWEDLKHAFTVARDSHTVLGWRNSVNSSLICFGGSMCQWLNVKYVVTFRLPRFETYPIETPIMGATRIIFWGCSKFVGVLLVYSFLCDKYCTYNFPPGRG